MRLPEKLLFYWCRWRENALAELLYGCGRGAVHVDSKSFGLRELEELSGKYFVATASCSKAFSISVVCLPEMLAH